MHATTGVVVAVDTSTNAVTATLKAQGAPGVDSLAITPDGAHLYAVESLAGVLSVIDTATGAATSIPIAGVDAVAISPDGRRAYVSANDTSTTAGPALVVLDTATNTVTATIGMPARPYSVSLTPDGSRAYVGIDTPASKVLVVDTTTNTVIGPVDGMPSARAMAFTRVVPQGPPVITVTATSGSTDSGWFFVYASTQHAWGDIASYAFDFGDGTKTTQASPQIEHGYEKGGTYTVTVLVTDTVSLTGTASTSVSARVPGGLTALFSQSNLRFVTADGAGAAPLVTNRAAAGPWEQFVIVDVGSGKVALRAAINNLYVAVDAASGYRLTANATTIDTPELFTVDTGADGIISLRSVLSGKYVSTNNGGGPMTADRALAGAWERFNEASYSGVATGFQARVNDRFVTAESGGGKPLIANRWDVGPWETFDLIDAGDGWVAFYSHADGRFVTAENAGHSPLIANRTAIGSWEKFKIVSNLDGTESIIANANGDYVTAENAGSSPLIANRAQVGPWEEFAGLPAPPVRLPVAGPLPRPPAMPKAPPSTRPVRSS